MNSYVKLAINTINNYISNGDIFDSSKADSILQSKKAGCFVTIHKKSNKELRGCIGTIIPTCKNLAGEIINNAISACQDSRFEPVSKNELNDLDISVDVLSPPEQIKTPEELNPKKYGVIVKAKDGRTGLLLPDLEGVDDINHQISIAEQKAGIDPKEDISLYRFSVKRYTM